MILALGTVQFGMSYGVANKSGQITVDAARSLLAKASVSRIDTIDTAISYGESELVLGSIGVTGWNVISKLPSVPKDCSNVELWVQDQMRCCLWRLRQPHIYGLLLHNPRQLLEDIGGELYHALIKLKRAGLVAKIGISVYGIEELVSLLNLYKFDLVQAPLNIVDRSLVESGWSRRLKEDGIELHVRSIFLQGLLLMHASMRPTKFNIWEPIWNVWDRWLFENEITPLEACLRYINTCPDVDRVIIGVDSVRQLEEIIQASEGILRNTPQFPPLNDIRLVNPSSWNLL